MSNLLLSQRIAKDLNFLTVAQNDVRSKYDLRLKVIKTYKLLVPLTLFNLRDPRQTDRMTELYKQPSKIIKQNELYKKYSKLPFHSVFIENETGGVLCEQKLDTVVFTIYHESGFVFPISMVYVDLTADGCICSFEGFSPDQTYQLEDKATSLVINLLEVLLFLNTKNVTTHHYTPSKKENSLVPKPLLPFYTYHIIDIFRDKKVYMKLSEVLDFINAENSDSSYRRACIVRGHFKTRSTGIFWWSDFVRNKKNIDKGFVDKDYRLNV